MIAECGGSSSAAEKNGEGDNSKSISRIQISLLLSGPISINPKPNRHLFSSSLYQKHCKAFNFSLSHLHLHFFSVFIACPYDTKFLFPTQIIMGRWMLGKNFIPLSFQLSKDRYPLRRERKKKSCFFTIACNRNLEEKYFSGFFLFFLIWVFFVYW